MPLSELVDRFLLEKTAKETRRAYARSIGIFLEFASVETTEGLLGVKRAHIVGFRNHLREDRDYSPAYIKRSLAACSSLYKWLIAEEITDSNPCELVKRYRVSREPRTEGMEESEVTKIFEACQDGTLMGLRDRAVLVTLYYQAVRRGSLSRLEMRDLRTRRGVMILRETKTSDYKEVPLRKETIKAINDYLAVLGSELSIFPGEREPVFVSFSPRTKGKRLSPHGIWQIVKRRVLLAGVPDRVVPHSFRKACATHMLDNGAKIEGVAEVLTHEQLATTQLYDNKRKGRSKAASGTLKDLTA